MAGELDLDVGSLVTLTLGDTTFSGYVVAGGTFAGASESTYTIAGGAAGWTKIVQPRPYQVASGVKLYDVLSQLAADAGETFDLTSVSPTAVIGDHWQRPAGPASVALSALFPLSGGGWRVDPDGQARPGPRPSAPLPPGLEFVVEDAPRGQRRARVGSAGDAVSAFLPGAIVTAGNLSSPIVVGEVTVRAVVDSVTFDLLGEAGLLEQLAALIQALTPPAPLTGLYRYQVVDDAGTPNLTPLATNAGLPPVLQCAKVYGLPGVTATLQPGAVVLVGFMDGSPARPFVGGYLSGVAPAKLDLSAATPGAALALAGPLRAWALDVNLKLAAAGHPAAALDPSVSTTIVFGA